MSATCSRDNGALLIQLVGAVHSLNVGQYKCYCLQTATLTNTGIATYIMLWPEDGRMIKEDIRRIYDGSIFYTLAERREKSS